MFTWTQFRLNIFVVVASLAIWSCSSNVAEDGPTDYIAELSSEDIIRIQKDNHWVLLNETLNNLDFNSSYENPRNEIAEVSGKFLLEFEQNCSKQQLFVAKKMWISSKSRNSEDAVLTIPNTIKERLYQSFADADYDKFYQEVASVQMTDWFLLLDDESKELFMIDLRIADECRANLIEYVSSNYFGYSRMSPGDRAVWREIAQNSDEEERADIIKASVEGALSGLGRSILSAASVAWSAISRLF